MFASSGSKPEDVVGIVPTKTIGNPCLASSKILRSVDDGTEDTSFRIKACLEMDRSSVIGGSTSLVTTHLVSRPIRPKLVVLDDRIVSRKQAI
jgi:hypothetical protein